MTERVERALLAILIASVLVTPFRRELFVGDETKYAQVVREMRAGAFFLPTLHGVAFTHKPPLHFWMIDVLTYPLGLYSLWPFVLPSLAAFAFLLWLMWRMGGPLAAFVCGSSLMVWGSAQTARMDVSFVAAIALAIWFLQRFLDGGERRLLLFSGAALGVATLIKGLMAPVIAIVLLLFEWWRRKRLPPGPYGSAFATMAIIPLLWFVPAMMIGGDAYTRDVLVKQTAGRAVGAWVHKAAPWFYVVHAPADLFPWFFLFIVAVVAVYKRRDEAGKFLVNWTLAVLIPYSVLSSKLDVYMMALIPPVSLLISRLAAGDTATRWGYRANLFTLGLLLGLGLGGNFILPQRLPVEVQPEVRGLFITLSVAALAALLVSIWRRGLALSTYLVGLVPIVALVYIAIALMPMANEMVSTRPLVRALERQGVEGEQIALHFTPHLWTRDMPRDLERVRYVSAEQLRGMDPEVIVTSRRRAGDIADPLTRYRKVDEVQMIGKWFDVYRK